jgi:hypothetical protein
MATWKFGAEAISFSIEQYALGGTAVEAWDEDGPYATISVKIPGAPALPEGHFYLKDWSENEPIARAMFAAGIIEAVTPSVSARSGFVTASAYRFTDFGAQYCQ